MEIIVRDYPNPTLAPTSQTQPLRPNPFKVDRTYFHSYKFSKSFNGNMYQNNGLESEKNKEQGNSPNPLWKEWQKACQLEERIRAARYRRNKIEKAIEARKKYLIKEREKMRKIALEQAQKDAVRCIERNWRSYRARFFLGANLKRFVKQKATVTIQKWVRVIQAKKKLLKLKEIRVEKKEKAAVTRIQSVFRMYRVKKSRKDYNKFLHKQATMIQALWRGYNSRIKIFNAKNIRKKSPSPKSFILAAPSEDNSNNEIYENNSKMPLSNDENGQWLRIGGGYTNVPNEIIEANPNKSKFEIAREYERKTRISGSRRRSTCYNKWTITKYDEMQKATQNSLSKGFEANQYPLSPTFDKHQDKEKKYISDMQSINPRTMTRNRNNNNNNNQSRGGNDESLQYYVDRKRRQINTEIGVIGRKTFEKSLNQNRKKRIVLNDPNTYICVCNKICNRLYPSCSECYTPNPYFNINSNANGNNNNKNTNHSIRPVQTELLSHSTGVSSKTIRQSSVASNFMKSVSTISFTESLHNNNNNISESLLSDYPNKKQTMSSNNNREILQSLFPPIPPSRIQLSNNVSTPSDEVPKSEHQIYISSSSSPKTPISTVSSSFRQQQQQPNNSKSSVCESTERRPSLLETTFPKPPQNRKSVSSSFTAANSINQMLEYPQRFTQAFNGRGKGYNPISVTIPSRFEYDEDNNNNTLMNSLMFREGGEPIAVQYNSTITGNDEYDDVNPSILSNARVGLVKTIL